VSWATVFAVRQYVKGSLWVIPLAGALTGALLAQALLWLDSVVTPPPSLQYSATTASGLLTAIVGAMTALLGFVVTVGVLVIQQATGTLSPRFMRLWYRDRLQKVVLATFVGTLTLSFALLREINAERVPDVGVTVAGGAVVVSVILLLLYLDRFVHRLRPVSVAAAVSRAGAGVFDRYAEVVTMADPDRGRGGLAQAAALAGETPAMLVRSTRAGALQAIDPEGLSRTAQSHDCVLVLRHAVGDFVTHEAVLVEVYGRPPFPVAQQLQGMFALGHERTIEQDPAFALRIMVDIAIRALSPAVNDPTTAVQVMDHVEDLVRTIGRTYLPGEITLEDDAGRLRVLVPGRTWDAYLALAVTEIRRFGAASPQVCRRLRAALEEWCESVLPEHRAAVENQLRLLDESVDRSFADPAERDFARTSDRQGIGGQTRRRH